MRQISRAGSKSGLTLIEIMMAVVIFAIGLLGLAATAAATLKMMRASATRYKTQSTERTQYEQTRLNNPSGFSLVEILAALFVASLIIGATLTFLVSQQRLYRGITDIMGVRGQLRDGEGVLATELRGTSVHGDTIRLMSDSAVEFFGSIGSSVLCSTPSGATIQIPPESLSTGNVLSSWQVTPDTGDLVNIYEDSTMAFPSGRWLRYRIAAFSPSTTPISCIQSNKAHTVTLTSAASPTLRSNAPVRFTRRGRYSLYRSSADNAWFLGYKRCNALGPSICGTIQPVSGPYRSYAKGGLGFRYKDSTGNTLLPNSDPTRVAQIEAVIRGETARDAHIVGANQGMLGKAKDSVLFTTTLRNR